MYMDKVLQNICPDAPVRGLKWHMLEARACHVHTCYANIASLHQESNNTCDYILTYCILQCVQEKVRIMCSNIGGIVVDSAGCAEIWSKLAKWFQNMLLQELSGTVMTGNSPYKMTIFCMEKGGCHGLISGMNVPEILASGTGAKGCAANRNWTHALTAPPHTPLHKVRR